MKIRDLKTGQIWDKVCEAFDCFCAHYPESECDNCPLRILLTGKDKEYGCAADCGWAIVDNIEKAIELMGYEIVYDKPRLCEVLGVDVDEVFEINGYPGNYYKVREDGTFMKKNCGKWLQCCDALNDSINAGVKHHPYWTEDDIADAKAIKRLCPTATTIFKNETSVDVEDADGHVWTVIKDRPDKRIIPSARTYEAVKLDDILGGDTNG